MPRALVLPALAAAAVAALPGNAAQPPSDPLAQDPCAKVVPSAFLQAPRAASRIPIAGATARERARLRQLLRRTPADAVTSISLDFKGWKSGMRVIHFRGNRNVRGDWESWLLVNSFMRGPDRTVRGYQAPRSGARLLGVGVYRWSGLIPGVVVEAADPAAYLRHRLAQVLPLLFKGTDGDYLLVVDRHHRRALEAGRAFDIGGLFVARSLDSCSPIVHSQPFGHSPPPCPAN